MCETASQIQRFLGPNKGPDIFLGMRQKVVGRLVDEIVEILDKARVA
jgi:hypothetical protein